jgi:hypothetical protein
MQKHAFSIHEIITPLVYHVSLQKNFICQKNSMGYAKKREMKNIHTKRHGRKKCMPKSTKKRKEREGKK